MLQKKVADLKDCWTRKAGMKAQALAAAEKREAEKKSASEWASSSIVNSQ